MALPQSAANVEAPPMVLIKFATISNITQDLIFNDTFQFSSVTASSPHHNGDNAHALKVPQGIYCLPSLANAINLQMASLFPSLPANPITFKDDQSKQRVIVVINIAFMQIEYLL